MTLHRWKKHPDFAARVSENVEAIRERIRSVGIAVIENRVSALNDRWGRLHRVMEARAAAALVEIDAANARADESRRQGADEAQLKRIYADESEIAPGMETGLLVRKEKPTKFGTVVEFAVDTRLLSELRAHELQAAKELGQQVDKHDLTSGGQPIKGYINFNTDEV